MDMQQAVEAEMGKTEQGQLFVTANLQRKIAGGRTIYCPCLAGLPADVALIVGILPVHDANQVLLDGLEGLNIDLLPDFAGICIADPFRRLSDVLDRIEATGITGVTNMPTVVPFLHSETESSYSEIHRAELRGLDLAAERGFDVLFITTPGAASAAQTTTLDQLKLIGF
jgi:predicted TIM-barrel enzyme